MSKMHFASQEAFSVDNSLPVSEIVRVNAECLHSLDLLRVAHDEVYEPSLVQKHDLETAEEWVERLEPDHPSQIVALVGGTNLYTDEPDVQAMSIAYYYPAHHSGQLAYLAVSPEARGASWGKRMISARLDALAAFGDNDPRGEVKAIVIETNDPKTLPPEGYSDAPQPVSTIFERLGAQVFDVNYVRPEIRNPSALTDHYRLMAYPNPRTGLYPDKHGMECALRGIYDEIGITEADTHPAFNQMIDEMKAWQGFSKRLTFQYKF